MKRKTILALILGLSLAPGSLRAEIGGLDNVPAATLLLPYFEVDLETAGGLTTLVSVTNAREDATVALVTLWTDLGIPTFSFNVYLTGYDIQTLNLRDVFAGTLPRTASAGQDPGDTVSPGGSFSLDPNLSTCLGVLPPAPLPATLVAHLRAAHAGQPSPILEGLCAGFDHGDSIARGYVTIDQMPDCTLVTPEDESYYGPGILGYENTLVGDYIYVDANQNFAQAETLVHIESDPTLGASHYTFYRGFSGGADRREGLGNAFLARFIIGGAFDGGTDFLVWRDTRTPIEPFDCDGPLPEPFPLHADQLAVFDEEENVEVPGDIILDPPQPPIAAFPLRTNRVAPDAPGLFAPFPFGWLYVNLNTELPDSPVTLGRIAQGFVSVLMKAEGRFSVGFDAYQLSNVTVPAEAVVEPIGPPGSLALSAGGTDR